MRTLTKYFSPVPHRLIRDGHLGRLQPPAASLYLFLICVGDKNGVSYYSDSAVKQRLNVENLKQAREELVCADLLAYDKPLYQVLSLPVKPVNAIAVSKPAGTTSAPFLSAEMNSAQSIRLKNDFNDHLKQYLQSIDGGRR